MPNTTTTDFVKKTIRPLTGLLKTKFDDEYMGGFWDHIRLWWFLRKLRALKKKALWEANIDKYYFETQMRHLIEYNDTEDRKFLQTESYKPEADRDMNKVYELQQKIADAKTIKQAYLKNEAFRTDVKTYIDMLEDFNEQTKA